MGNSYGTEPSDWSRRPPSRPHTVYSEIGDKVIAHVRSGSFATEAACSAFRPTSASPR